MAYKGYPTNPQEPMKTLRDASDRFCVECGLVIRGQNKDKPKFCPHRACGKPLPYRKEMWDEVTKWGRCTFCDSFMHRWYQYCQACGASNLEAQRRKRQLERQERQREQFELKRLRAENAELRELRQWKEEFLQQLEVGSSGHLEKLKKQNTMIDGENKDGEDKDGIEEKRKEGEENEESKKQGGQVEEVEKEGRKSDVKDSENEMKGHEKMEVDGNENSGEGDPGA